ncbi:hypothetical protein DB31_3080 [Hyalangium minutum]|uniref:Uncharacterized protein n=1 Tax=Hyalangium minutum TaxID=394096 RepID=A0A085W5Q8_9BACT|nr:hypothetical protein DB31_3080 [Hyalangium minutum]
MRGGPGRPILLGRLRFGGPTRRAQPGRRGVWRCELHQQESALMTPCGVMVGVGQFLVGQLTGAERHEDVIRQAGR